MVVICLLLVVSLWLLMLLMVDESWTNCYSMVCNGKLMASGLFMVDFFGAEWLQNRKLEVK